MSPLLDSFGSSKGYGWTASLGGPNFIAALQNTSYNYGVNYDSNGNVYSIGYSSSASDVFIIKRNAEGEIVWQKRYENSGAAETSSIVADESGNVYFATLDNGNPKMQVVKLTSAGNITWQKSLEDFYGSMSKRIKIGPDGNIYVGGTFNISGIPYNFVAKYDTSGNLTFQRRGSTNQTGFRDIAIDSGNNILGSGWYQPGDYERGTIQKYNTTGTSNTWGRYFGPASSTTANYLFCSGIAVDSSDNVYSHGHFNNGAGNSNGVLYKLNSSGTLQWQRFVTYGSQSVDKDVASDASGNTYTLGYNNSGNVATVINKTDASGNQVFSRSISVSGGGVYGYTIETDGTYLYVSGYANVSPNSYGLTIKVPADGTKTGTYVVGPITVSYSSGGASMSTSTIGENTVTLPMGTSSATNATPTNIITTTTLTENRKNF